MGQVTESPFPSVDELLERYKEKIKGPREICVADFWGKGDHLYKDELGWDWRAIEQMEAESFDPKEIFQYNIVDFGWSISFYYPETDTFYAIDNELYPIVFKRLPKTHRSKYRGLESDGDFHSRGWPLQRFKSRDELWDGIKINGKSLEYVLNHSYIMQVC